MALDVLFRNFSMLGYIYWMLVYEFWLIVDWNWYINRYSWKETHNLHENENLPLIDSYTVKLYLLDVWFMIVIFFYLILICEFWLIDYLLKLIDTLERKFPNSMKMTLCKDVSKVSLCYDDWYSWLIRKGWSFP
jgi:hypothetical protein